MKKLLALAFVLMTIIFFGCETNDYDITAPYGEKSKRDLEISSYNDLGNDFGDYVIFGPAGGFKKDEYKEQGWRLWGETKPRAFSSSDLDGFMMPLYNIHDDQAIIWNGFGHYKYEDDDYGYPLDWQDFKAFVERSEYRVVLATGDTTVAIRLKQGKIYKVDTNWHDIYAWFTLDKNLAYVNDPVLFDGSGSKGVYRLPEQTWIKNWHWYVNGVWVGQGEKYTHHFPDAGIFTVKLIVDDGINWREMEATIQILEGTDPDPDTELPWGKYERSKGNVYTGYAKVLIDREWVIILWGNGNLVKGLKDNPYFFGNFSGDENVAWELIPAKNDPNFAGWWYVTVPLKENLDVYWGWGGTYRLIAGGPVFTNTNFDHMPYCYGWGCGPNGENGPDDATKDIYLKVRNWDIQEPCN
ncbi:MAG: hypothetical protein V1865_01190 [bacterium]